MKQYSFSERKFYDLLRDGRALVYYNEEKAIETDTHEDGSEETRTVWRYSRTIAESASRDDIIAALIRVRYSTNDELALSRQKDDKINEYNAYNAYAEWCKAYARRVLEGDNIETMRAMKIADVGIYDASESVNSFSVGNLTTWLSPDRRSNLKNAVEALVSKGMNTVTFMGFEIPANMALQMLVTIESYAAICSQVTESHKAAISELQSERDIERYDFTVGYPEHPVFEI